MASDVTDPTLAWTVQSVAEDGETRVALELPEAVPGQVFHASQLPVPANQIEVGVTPDAWRNLGGTLVVFDDVAEALRHPSGPTPADLRLAEPQTAPASVAAAVGVPSALPTSPAEAEVAAKEQGGTSPVDATGEVVTAASETNANEQNAQPAPENADAHPVSENSEQNPQAVQA